MIEQIDLSAFELKSNFVLVKADADYDVVVIPGPEGTKVELKLFATGEQEANHFSISGTVIKRPYEFFYFNKYGDNVSGMSQTAYASAIKASMSVKCEHPYQAGDKIYYNYNVQLQCEEENRLLETQEHGICMLIPADQIIAYVKDEELVPVNGYVFFERDKPETMSASGLIYIPENAQKHYEKNNATVIAGSSPVKAYLDGGLITNETYEKGERIVVDRRFGYKMAYDLHAKELKNVEVCLQKHIVCKLESAA